MYKMSIDYIWIKIAESASDEFKKDLLDLLFSYYYTHVIIVGASKIKLTEITISK